MKYVILIVILVNFFVGANGFLGGLLSVILSGLGLISDIMIAQMQANQAEVLADKVYNQIELQNIENRQQFQHAFDGIETLGNNLDTFQEDTAHNFMQISRHITSLGNSIDKNHQEVLQIFGVVNDQFRRIGNGLSQLDNKIQRTFDVITAQKETDPYLSSIINEMNGKIQKFKEYTDEMDISYQYYMRYSKDIMAYSNQTLLDFVANMISHSDSSPMSLSQKIHKMLTSHDGFLRHFSESGVQDYLVCTKQESPQYFVYGLYMTAVFAELKGLIVSTFARNLNVYFDQGTLSKERMVDMETSVEHIKTMTATVRVILSNLDRMLRTCDSPYDEAGIPFYEFTDFISYPSSSSDRYISLSSMDADVANGRVVTDIRFKEHYDTIYLQIQEAQIGPLASINPSTAYWVPVDRGYAGEKVTLTKENSRFDIDIFRGLPGHTVTGVRFHEITNGVTLEVRVTPFNPITGVLDHPKSMWLNNMNETNMRERIDFTYARSPVSAWSTPVVMSSTNQYLHFTQTGYPDTESIIPFFDTRAVLPSILAPLSGLGLLYKSASDRYGGYLAPTIVCLDYSQFIESDIQLPKRHSMSKLFQSRRPTNSLANGNGSKTPYGLAVIVFSIISKYVACQI